MESFRLHSGCDLQVFGITEETGPLFSQIRKIFEAVRFHIGRRPTAYLQTLHFRFYNQGLDFARQGREALENTEFQRKVRFVILSDLINPPGSPELESVLQAYSQRDLGDEVLIVSSLLSKVPLDARKFFRKDFFRRMQRWASQQPQNHRLRELVENYDSWSGEYDGFLIRIFRRPWKSIPAPRALEAKLSFLRTDFDDDVELKPQENNDPFFQEYLSTLSRVEKMDHYQILLIRMERNLPDYTVEEIDSFIKDFEPKVSQIDDFLSGRSMWIPEILKMLFPKS